MLAFYMKLLKLKCYMIFRRILRICLKVLLAIILDVVKTMSAEDRFLYSKICIKISYACLLIGMEACEV